MAIDWPGGREQPHVDVAAATPLGPDLRGPSLRLVGPAEDVHPHGGQHRESSKLPSTGGPWSPLLIGLAARIESDEIEVSRVRVARLGGLT